MRHVNRSASILVWALLMLTVTGCPNARQKALSVGLTSLNAARDGFMVWDAAHQKAIVDACNPPDCTLEKGQANLRIYRATREPVLAGFVVAYEAIAICATDGTHRLDEVATAMAAVMNLVKVIMDGPASLPASIPASIPAVVK